MCRFTAVILRDDMPGVLETVARAGVLHLTSVEETEAWARQELPRLVLDAS